MVAFIRTAAAALALLIALTLQALAGSLNLDFNNIAIQGHDPVAYFTEGKPVAGSEEITVEHDGATYRFASAANKAAFEAEPEKYLPAYGGYCAFGMAHGYKAPIVPEAFTIVDGRLYLNNSLGVREKWQSDIPGYVSRADKAWTESGG